MTASERIKMSEELMHVVESLHLAIDDTDIDKVQISLYFVPETDRYDLLLKISRVILEHNQNNLNILKELK